jgi:hypothetical protein
MMCSPVPVKEIATWSSAQVPGPIIGVSPTRPSIFMNVPPVEVAAASVPDKSSATAPTVPCFCSDMSSAVTPTGKT